MAWPFRDFHRRALLLAGVSLAALSIAIAAQSKGQAAVPGANPMRMLLRLHELPPEYQIGDDSGCGPFDFEGTPAMTEFTEKYRPKGCYFEYERLFRLLGYRPDPPLVASLSVTTPSVAAAEAGAEIAPELLGYATGDEELMEITPQATIGDATRLFHVDDALVLGRRKQSGSVLFWRSGSALAAVYVAGRPSAAADRISLRFARLQQAHIERPTTYTKAQRDDTLVPLNNPRIDFPIYWLGRKFRPGRGFPASSLWEALAPLGPGDGPVGMRALLKYDDISLGVWTRSSWRRYSKSVLGRLVRDWRRTKATTLTLPNGHATIYAGYAKDFSSCPRQHPKVFLAEVHLGRMVIGIDPPYCVPCVEARNGPYDSRRGLEAVVQALRLRSPPEAQA